MNPQTQVRTAPELRDAKLFRQAAYIDGQWIEKDKTIDVDNPATGEVLGTVPQLDAADTRRAIEAANRAFPGVAGEDREGARRRAAPLVRPDDGESGRPGAADDARAGQAAQRIEGRDGVRGVVPRMVRRRSQARVRRHDPAAPARQADRRPEGADRRRGLHHAVEFSAGDDHAQGRPGHRRGLHGRPQACFADAVLGARARRAQPSAPDCPRACSTSSPDRPESSAAS